MGWDFQHRSKGQKTIDLLRGHFESNTPDRQWEILAHSQQGRTVYLAVKITDKNATPWINEVVAFVVLTAWRRVGPCNWGYKIMDENMGPGECEAPAKVLDLLTPTDHKWALEWRQKCRENIAKKKSRPVLEVGRIIEFEKSIAFPNGLTVRQMKVVQLKPLRFAPLGYAGRIWYRVQRWRLDGARVIILDDDDELLYCSDCRAWVEPEGRHCASGLYCICPWCGERIEEP